MQFVTLSEELINEVQKQFAFRIEHVIQHTGPYQTKLKDGTKFDISDTFPINLKENPPPMKDISLKDAANETDRDISWHIRNGLFCFNSIKQMRKWFGSKAIKWMLDDVSEFVIVKKSIPEDKVLFGDSQVIVDKKTWIKASSKIVKF